MPETREVVITGIGLVCPIGVGKEPVWRAFRTGQSGVRPISLFDASGLPVRIAGEIPDFSPKPFIANRKSLKVMARDSQIGVAASTLACQDAGIAQGKVNPDRFGVLLGADKISGSIEESRDPYRQCIVDGKFDFARWGTLGISASFPLSFLRVLPNMVASHISIAQDARGPNNTIHQGDVSSLLAITEAMRVIQRGMADVMIAGGASSRMTAFDWVYHCVTGRLSTRQDDPAHVARPFDADRSGEVFGEGAAAFLLESRRHAEDRGATIVARILGGASACETHGGSVTGAGLQRAIALAMSEAGLAAGEIGHVNAHGASTLVDDAIEARALQAVLPGVPITAPKSYFGNLGAASGAVEMAASVFSFSTGLVPVTLNYTRPDPDCPGNVVCGEPLTGSLPTALLLNWTQIGQAAALVLAGPD